MTYLKVLQNLTLFQTQVPPDVKNEQIYILKKRVVPVTSENCRELLLFGLLTPPVLLQLSCAVKQVTVPPIFIHISHKEAFLSISNLPVWVLGELVMFLSSQDMCSTAVRQQKPSDLATSDIWRHPSTCGNHVQSDLSCAGTGYGENCPPYSNSSWLDGKATRHLWKVRKQPSIQCNLWHYIF